MTQCNRSRRRIGRIAALGVLAMCSVPAFAQPATRPTSQPTTWPFRPRTPVNVSPADAARLAQQGKTNAFVHDPSTIVRCGDEYWCYATGRGINVWHSPDLVHWSPGPAVFEQLGSWAEQAVPMHHGTGVWAPDVVHLEDRYLLFYSVSTFGKQTSAIAVAHNATLTPTDANYKWVDDGIVVQSNERENFNAIDPSVFHDLSDGKLWLSFGSYWTGIKLVELDPKTGKRINHDPPVAIASQRDGIEASFLTRHGSHYYLFVNWGLCCRGVESTYEIRVGRSDRVTGPYVDRNGKPLLEGGGTSVLHSDGKFIGPGHAGIVVDGDGKEWFSCHYYDGAEAGTSHLAVRPLTWDAAGWPVVGERKD